MHYHSLTHSRSHSLTHSRSHSLTHSQSHSLTHGATHQLRGISSFLSRLLPKHVVCVRKRANLYRISINKHIWCLSEWVSEWVRATTSYGVSYSTWERYWVIEWRNSRGVSEWVPASLYPGVDSSTSGYLQLQCAPKQPGLLEMGPFYHWYPTAIGDGNQYSWRC